MQWTPAKRLLLLTIIAACSAVFQFWFSTLIFQNAISCAKIFDEFNETSLNQEACNATLYEDPIALRSKCECHPASSPTVAYWRYVDNITLMCTSLGFSLLLASELARSIIVCKYVICQPSKMQFARIDIFSIMGFIAILIRRNHVLNFDFQNGGSLNLVWDCFFVIAISRCRDSFDNVHDAHSVQSWIFLTFVATLFSITRSFYLNMDCFYRKPKKEEHQSLLPVA